MYYVGIRKENHNKADLLVCQTRSSYLGIIEFESEVEKGVTYFSEHQT